MTKVEEPLVESEEKTPNDEDESGPPQYEGFQHLWYCLREGSMDFVGQERAYNFHFYVIWAAGFVGFIVGFLFQSFMITFLFILISTIIVTVICLPSWPIFNRHPVEWLEPPPMPEDKKKSKKEKKDKKEKKTKKGEKGGSGTGEKKEKKNKKGDRGDDDE